VMGRIPYDAKGAAVLNGQSGARHTPARSALGRAAARIAGQASAHGQQGRASHILSPMPLRAVPPMPASPVAVQPVSSQNRNGVGR
jgi:hypothetical protein